MAIDNQVRDWYYYDYNTIPNDRYYIDKDYTTNIGYKTYIKGWHTFKTSIEHLVERIRGIGVDIENVDIYTADDYMKLSEELDKLKVSLWAKVWKDGQYKSLANNKRNKLKDSLLEDELFEI